jgi:hypothetical protein
MSYDIVRDTGEALALADSKALDAFLEWVTPLDPREWALVIKRTHRHAGIDTTYTVEPKEKY